MSRPKTGGETLFKHIFQGVSFRPMSELGKFCINFSPLNDMNSMMMPIFAIELFIFWSFSRLEV